MLIFLNFLAISSICWPSSLSLLFVQITGSNLSVGSMETANMGMQRYHEAITSRSSQSLRHPPSVNHRHQTHHALPPMLGPRGPNNLPPASHRFSSNSSHSNSNSSQNSLEFGHRHAGTVPPTGIRIYRPHRGVNHDNTLRQQHLAHLRFLHADVIFLSLSPMLYSTSTFILFIFSLGTVGSMFCMH